MKRSLPVSARVLCKIGLFLVCIVQLASCGQGETENKKNEATASWEAHLNDALQSPVPDIRLLAWKAIADNQPPIDPSESQALLSLVLSQRKHLSLADKDDDENVAENTAAAAKLCQIAPPGQMRQDSMTALIKSIAGILTTPPLPNGKQHRKRILDALADLGDDGVPKLRELLPTLTEAEISSYIRRIVSDDSGIAEQGTPLPLTAAFLAEASAGLIPKVSADDALMALEQMPRIFSDSFEPILAAYSKADEERQEEFFSLLANLAVYRDGNSKREVLKIAWETAIEPAATAKRRNAYMAIGMLEDELSEQHRLLLPSLDRVYLLEHADAAQMVLTLGLRNRLTLASADAAAIAVQTTDKFNAILASWHLLSRDNLSGLEPLIRRLEIEHRETELILKEILQIPGTNALTDRKTAAGRILFELENSDKVASRRIACYELLLILGEFPAELSGSLEQLVRQEVDRRRSDSLLRLMAKSDGATSGGMIFHWPELLMDAKSREPIVNRHIFYELLRTLGPKAGPLQLSCALDLRNSRHFSTSVNALNHTTPRNPRCGLVYLAASESLSQASRIEAAGRVLFAIHHSAVSPQCAGALIELGCKDNARLLAPSQKKEVLDYVGSNAHSMRDLDAEAASALRLLGSRSHLDNADRERLLDLQQTLSTQQMLRAQNSCAQLLSLIPPPPPKFVQSLAAYARDYWFVALAHPLCWVAILWWYPFSRRIQALFIFNPVVRKFLGFGYVGGLICTVPWLSRRVLRPLFAESSSPELDTRAATYFDDREVAVGKMTELSNPAGIIREKIAQVLPKINGRVIILGDSGIGKTELLHHFVRQEPDCVVLLKAQNCKDGVVEVIAEKLMINKRDKSFAEGLIFSGAMKVAIDGLNEVSAADRDAILEFAGSMKTVDVLITSRPLVANLPDTLGTMRLLPLRNDQISAFALRQTPQLTADHQRLVETFVGQCLVPGQPEDILQRNREMLTTPLDLTFVVKCLISGRQPDMNNILLQQHQLMLGSYEWIYKIEFPEETFARFIYEQRANGTNDAFVADRFAREWKELERSHLALRQESGQSTSHDGDESSTRWVMRHPRISDFYVALHWKRLVQARRNQTPAVIREHANAEGTPFWGVYDLLLDMLTGADRKRVLEAIAVNAAKTGEHVLADWLLSTRTRDFAEDGGA